MRALTSRGRSDARSGWRCLSGGVGGWIERMVVLGLVLYGTYVFDFLHLPREQTSTLLRVDEVAVPLAAVDATPKRTPKKRPTPSPSSLPPSGEPFSVANLQQFPKMEFFARFESVDEEEELKSRNLWHQLFYVPNSRKASVKEPLLPCHLWAAVHAPDVAAMLMLQYYPGDCRAIYNPMANVLCRNRGSFDVYGCRMAMRAWEVCEDRRQWGDHQPGQAVQICSLERMPRQVATRGIHAAQVNGPPTDALVADYEVRDGDGDVIAVKPLPVAWGGSGESGMVNHFAWGLYRGAAMAALEERLPYDPVADKQRYSFFGGRNVLQPSEYCMTKRIMLQHANPAESRGPAGLSARALHGIASGLRLIGVPYLYQPLKTRRLQAGLSLDGTGILLASAELSRGTDDDVGETHDATIMDARRQAELIVERQFDVLALGPDVRWSNVAPVAMGIDYHRVAGISTGDERPLLWDDLYSVGLNYSREDGGASVDYETVPYLSWPPASNETGSSSTGRNPRELVLKSTMKKVWLKRPNQKRPYPWSAAEALNMQMQRLKPKLSAVDKKAMDAVIDRYKAFMESSASTGEHSAYALHWATRDKVDELLDREERRRAALQAAWAKELVVRLPASPTPSPGASASAKPTQTPLFADDDELGDEDDGQDGEMQVGMPFLAGLGSTKFPIQRWAKRSALRVSENPLQHKHVHARQPLFSDPLNIAFGAPDLTRRHNKGIAYLPPPVDDIRFARTSKFRIPFPKGRLVNILFFNNSRGPLGAAVAAAVAGVTKVAFPSPSPSVEPEPWRASAPSSRDETSPLPSIESLRENGIVADEGIVGPALLNFVRPDPEAEKVHNAISQLLQQLKKDFRVLVVPGTMAVESEKAIKLLSGETSIDGAAAAQSPQPLSAADKKVAAAARKMYAEGIWTGGLPAVPSYLDDPTLLYAAFRKTALGIVVSDCRGIARVPPMPTPVATPSARSLAEQAPAIMSGSKGNTTGSPSYAYSGNFKFTSAFRPIGDNSVLRTASNKLNPFELTGNPHDITTGGRVQGPFPYSNAFTPASAPVSLLSHYTEDCLAPIPSAAAYFDVDGNEIDREKGDATTPASSVMWLDHSLNEAMAAEIPLLRIRVYTEAAADRSGVRREKDLLWKASHRRVLQQDSATTAATQGAIRGLPVASSEGPAAQLADMVLPSAPSSRGQGARIVSEKPLAREALSPPNPYWAEEVTGRTLTIPKPGFESDYSARELDVVIKKVAEAFEAFVEKVTSSLEARNRQLPDPSPSSTPMPTKPPVEKVHLPSHLPVEAGAEQLGAPGKGSFEQAHLPLRLPVDADHRQLREPREAADGSTSLRGAGCQGVAATHPTNGFLDCGDAAKLDGSLFSPAAFISRYRGLVATAVDVVQMLCGFGTKWTPRSAEEILTDAWDFEDVRDFV